MHLHKGSLKQTARVKYIDNPNLPSNLSEGLLESVVVDCKGVNPIVSNCARKDSAASNLDQINRSTQQTSGVTVDKNEVTLK